MNTARPAFEALNPALVGYTITLRSPTIQVTGLLIGFHVHGATSLTLAGSATVEDVAVTAFLHTAGEVVQLPITRVAPDMTLEVHP